MATDPERLKQLMAGSSGRSAFSDGRNQGTANNKIGTQTLQGLLASRTSQTVVPPPAPPAPPAVTSTVPTTDISTLSNPAQVVPGTAAGSNQINVADFAGQMVTDPKKGMSDDMLLSENLPQPINPNTEGTNVSQEAMDPSKLNQTAAQAETQTAQQVDPRQATGFDPQLTQENIEQNAQMEAAQGEVSQGAQMEAPQIDLEATAAGENAVGAALNDFATQDLNTVDPKATLKGQLDILQSEFVDAEGNPKIPSWAAGTARSVSKIAAFSGMSGTAATAAMSQALLEASASVAAQDAQFFQTLTLQNLSNEQASIINKANVLAQMDLANMDSRLTAAVQNSKNFMEMDLANLNNRQQEALINTQNRVQSILEDAKATNTARMFEADSQNEMDKFYDQLNTSISQFNAAQVNGMNQFNTTEANNMSQFNASLENQREQFYRDMQFNIDIANAKWRQTVTLTENQQAFDAAALDVKNMVGISTEQLNQIWDRSDAMLDYIWKSSENQLDRDQRLAEIKLAGKFSKDAAKSEGIGNILGTVAGAITSKLFG